MTKELNEKSFFTKVKKVFKKAGIEIIYVALLLFYVLKNSKTPNWIKVQIVGALIYFISPLDAIPDYLPIVGYSDDMGVLLLALKTAIMYIDGDVKNDAKNRLKDWFGNFDETQLTNIENKL